MSEASKRVVFGVHPVRVLLRRHPETVERLYLGASTGALARRHQALRTLAERHRIATEVVDGGVLDARADGGRHQGVVAQVRSNAPSSSPGASPGSSPGPPTGLEGLIARFEARDPAQPAPLLLVLDEVQDPHNLGACIRSAAAAGVDAVVVPRRRAAGMGPAVRKVASGASEVVPLITVSNLVRALERLSEVGVRIIGASASVDAWHYECDLTGPVALVLGGEAAGLRRLTERTCDALVAIPMPGPMESLNVSVSAGVLLFEAVRQRAEVGRIGHPASQGPRF